MPIYRWMGEEDMVYIHSGMHLAIKKKEIMPFAAIWMDLEIIILSEVNQTKTDIIWYHLYVEYKKTIRINLFIKTKQSKKKEVDIWNRVTKGRRDKLEVWD